MRRFLIAAGFIAAMLAAWELLVRAGVVSTGVVPAPHQVARYLGKAATDGTLLEATVTTARRLAVGYLLGLLAGLPLGFLLARFQAARDTLGVVALGLQTLPSVCWVPLSIAWFHQTESAMQFVVVMGTVWSIAIATESGVRNVPPLYQRSAETMGSKGLHTLLRVTFPAALPWIVSGMKQGWAFAWRSLMAAEIYVTILSGFGLGFLLHVGRDFGAMDQVVGVMLVIVAVGLAADRAVFYPAESWLRRRWGTERRA